MEVDPSRIVASLVGLPVVVAGVIDVAGEPLRVVVVSVGEAPACGHCGGLTVFKDHRSVELVDLAVFGRQCRLVWRKRRFRCVSASCPVRVFTEQNAAVAPAGHSVTTRAGKWCCVQVGRDSRSVHAVARELGADWGTVNAAVVGWGAALLAADTDRIHRTDAVGLDEALLVRRGPKRVLAWTTAIVDVRHGQLLDLVEGRNTVEPTTWLLAMPALWREQIRWAALDLSGIYRAVFEAALPDATMVADPFHVVRLANAALDEVRRRVQNETFGHRGRKDDPLYRARKLLVMAHEHLDDHGDQKLQGLLTAGDPKGEVKTAWHAKEVVRSIYEHDDPTVARAFLAQLAVDLQDHSCPPEIHRLGRTLARWLEPIIAWHRSHITNAATEAANNLCKRVKRTAFGFTNFAHYRIRALLYAGKPNWHLLPELTTP